MIIQCLTDYVDHVLANFTNTQIDVLAQMGRAIIDCEREIPQDLWCSRCLERKERILELVERWKKAAKAESLHREINGGSQL